MCIIQEKGDLRESIQNINLKPTEYKQRVVYVPVFLELGDLWSWSTAFLVQVLSNTWFINQLGLWQTQDKRRRNGYKKAVALVNTGNRQSIHKVQTPLAKPVFPMILLLSYTKTMCPQCTLCAKQRVELYHLHFQPSWESL